MGKGREGVRREWENAMDRERKTERLEDRHSTMRNYSHLLSALIVTMKHHKFTVLSFQALISHPTVT